MKDSEGKSLRENETGIWKKVQLGGMWLGETEDVTARDWDDVDGHRG